MLQKLNITRFHRCRDFAQSSHFVVVAGVLLVSSFLPPVSAGEAVKSWPKADREISMDGPERVTWTPVDGVKDRVVEGEPAANETEPEHFPILMPAAYEVDEIIESPIEDYLQSPMGESVQRTCDSDSCDCSECSPHGPIGLWIRGEYLLWSLDGMSLPALVTSSSAGTTPENTGVLGLQTTDILIGNDTVGDDARSGAKFSLGWWDNPSRTAGIEASYLGLERTGETLRADSSQFPNLARPYFDTLNNANAALLIASSVFLTGTVSIETESELQAFDIVRRQRISQSHCHRLDFLFGYRHGRLEESIRIDQSSLYTAPQGQIIAGTTKTLFDSFETNNKFNGVQLGMHYQHISGPMKLNAMAKLGLGANQANVIIDGETVNTVPGDGTSVFAGGLLAQTTNMGSYEQTDFIVLPEVGLTLTTHLNRCTQLTIGYHLMYWSKVARAADQIDLNVSQLPPEPSSGTQSPEFRFISDDFIAHGLQAGLEYQF